MNTKSRVFRAQQRHAEYYFNRLEATSKNFREGGENIPTALIEFDQDWEQIQRGQAWAVSQEDKSVEISALVCNYPLVGVELLDLRQPADVRIRWSEQGLIVAQSLKEYRTEAAHLGNLAAIHEEIGQYEQAINNSTKAITIFRETGDRHGEGNALSILGSIYNNQGRYEEAGQYFEQALAIHREIGNQYGEGSNLNNLGNIYAQLGQYEQAIKYYEQALNFSREMNDWNKEGTILSNLGVAYRYLGQYEQAIEYLKQAYDFSHKIGNREREGAVLSELGFMLAYYGHH